MTERLRTLFGLAAIAVVLAGPAAAAPLPELAIEKYELPNGLDVILHEDHDAPIVSVNVWYHVGSKDEVVGRTGFAHLFEHMMFQGSEHHDQDYFEPLEKIGAFVNGSTTEDRTNYIQDVPSNYLELVLFLEADRMGFLLPAMTQEKLDNQRDVVKNERRQGLDNQPYAKSQEMIPPLAFPADHPYSWSTIGSMEDLTAATLDDVKEFFRRHYVPNNASLCIAGDFEPAEAKRLVEKYFAPLPPGPPVERLTAWRPRLSGVKRARAEDNVNLPRLYTIWSSPAHYAPGDAEMDLLASALGGGKTSRLYKSLVYEKQIAQEVFAFQESMEMGSLFNIWVTAREGHTLEEIERALDEELAAVLSRGISSSEVAQAQATFEASFVRKMEEVGGFSGLADQINRYNTFLGDPQRFQWDLDRYLSASASDVNRYARDVIDLDNRVILEIVPQGTLTAEAADPLQWAEVPGPGREPEFAPPEIQRARLENGLEIYVVERPKIPLVQTNLLLKSGWASDPADRPGAAALTADLLNEGTRRRSALEISKDLKKLGAEMNTQSFFDGSSASLNVIKRNLEPGLAILADVVLHPVFPADELERRRQSYLGEIAKEEKEPFASAFKAFQRELFPNGHPYGQPYTGSGTVESIKAITREDLVAYYERNYFPNNAALVMVGDISLDEARRLADDAFGKWEPGDVERVEVPTPPALSETRVCIVDKPGAAQSMIVAGTLGMRRNDPDFDSFKVMNNAFAGQFTSRLNMNLREDKGYAYGAWGFSMALRGVGAYVCFAPVQTQSTKESVVEIVTELRDLLGSRPLTDQEVSDSKSNLIQSFPQEFTTVASIASELSELVMYDLPLDDWTQYATRVESITGGTATASARSHLDPDALLIVVVGDREKIEAGLRELQLGEVVTIASRR